MEPSKKKKTIGYSSTSETFTITLIPCDYGSSGDEDSINLSEDSMNSSEILDSSDDEIEIIKIKKIIKSSKELDIIKENEAKKN